jgi:hypothetical protein
MPLLKIYIFHPSKPSLKSEILNIKSIEKLLASYRSMGAGSYDILD